MSRMKEMLLLENDGCEVTEDHESVVQADERQPTNEAPHERHTVDVKDFKYDVFISYSASDRPWVKDILLQSLEQEGKKVCIDYRDFQPGVPVIDNVVHGIENSQVTVLVMTPAFVQSEWCMYESKQALVSSLATSRARVLPLILMECDIPNILKHLTYLDHTSEDVQPYFKEQLIDSLNNAEKWVPADNHGSDIVPISEVQQVVSRSLDQDKKRETAINKLMGAFSSFRLLKRRVLVCITCPYITGLAYFLPFAVIFVYSMAAQKFQITPLEPTFVNSTATNIFFSFKIHSSVAEKCEVLSITNKYSGKPTLFDTFAFDDFMKSVVYDQENTTHFVTSLSAKKMFKQKRFRIYGDMSAVTKFCFRSQNSSQNATLRLYKPTSSSDVNKFDQTSDPWRFSGVNYNDYTSIGNEMLCSISVIKGQSLTSNEFNALVFKNVGNTPLFLNLTNIFKIPNLKKYLAFGSCLNLSECHIPSSHRIRYIVVSKNINTPSDYGVDNENEFKCIYELPVLSTSILFVGAFLAAIFFLFLIFTGFNKKCEPRLQKWYFGRKIVREKLGEAAVQMIEDSHDLHELSKTIKHERENKEFTI